MTEMTKEYGTALFILAKENGAEKEYAEALDTVLSVFRENPEYIDFLASPSIPKRERLDAAEQALRESVPEHIVSFVQLLCERGRIRGFEACVKEYKKLLDAVNLVSSAKVTSTVKLTEQEEERLKEKLEKLTGHSVILECSTDRTLLGGMVVEIDGKIMDGSLRHRLREVKDVISR